MQWSRQGEDKLQSKIKEFTQVPQAPPPSEAVDATPSPPLTPATQKKGWKGQMQHKLRQWSQEGKLEKKLEKWKGESKAGLNKCLKRMQNLVLKVSRKLKC